MSKAVKKLLSKVPYQPERISEIKDISGQGKDLTQTRFDRQPKIVKSKKEGLHSKTITKDTLMYGSHDMDLTDL